jgi:drug/metabolite transporter (DMT)-like permease
LIDAIIALYIMSVCMIDMDAKSSLGAERKLRSARIVSRRFTTTFTTRLTLILLLLILVFTHHVPATVAFQNPGRRHHAKAIRKRSTGSCLCLLGPTTSRARILRLSDHNDEDGENDDDTSMAGIAAAAAEDRKKGLLILLTVPFAWGTFEPAVRYVYSIDPPIDTFIFSLAYYTVASVSLVAAATLASSRQQSSSQDSIDDDDNDEDGLSDNKSASAWPIQGGLELGTYLVVGNTLQVLGLKTVPADRAAFLLQLTTLFVPVLDAVFQRSFKAVTARTWAACVVALAGVGAMGLDDGGGGGSSSDSVSELSLPQRIMDVFSHPSSGDALIVAAAVAYTFHCLRLEGYAKQTSAVKLAASKACVETFLSALTVAGLVLYSQNTAAIDSSTAGQGNDDSLQAFLKTSGQDVISFVGSFDDYLSMPSSVWIPAVGAVLWTGWVTVAYTIYAQSYGQRRVQPVTANLIYTFQPVCTAIIAWLLLGESLGPAGYVGGALIGSAALIVVAPEKE